MNETLVQNLDVQRLANIFREAAAINNNIIYIGIMPTDLQFGLGRMWEAHSVETPFKEKIVRSRKDAQSFLNEIGVMN